jgi:hypothetical protein
VFQWFTSRINAATANCGKFRKPVAVIALLLVVLCLPIARPLIFPSLRAVDNFHARRLNLTNTAVICSIVSNEEYYLDEWIDYNLGIGFDHIHIYDNTDEYGLGHGWLERRADRLKNRVTIQHYPGEGKQSTAYRDCARRVLSDRHRWVFFTDADEFLVLKKHDNVTSFLLQHDTKRTAVAINWQVQSWNNQMQYSPQPVTKRFASRADTGDINFHVKTISNVDKIDLGARHNPHFATLKRKEYLAVDTTGKTLHPRTPYWNNQNPSDVALVYHHNTKSWKELVGKRTRGRADMEGPGLAETVKLLISNAHAGKGLDNTTEVDVSAWEMLKSRNPKYKFFDAKDTSNVIKNQKQTEGDNARAQSIGICCYAKDQEAYIDEWMDYHLALGFDKLYIYDGSEKYWMEQWGEARNDTRLSLVHFPPPLNDENAGNSTMVLNDKKARAYADCVGRHGKEHSGLVLVDVNDFFVIPDHSSIEPLVQLLDSSACAHQFERVLFGHGDQYLYDPLPVTKRFVLRVNDKTPGFASSSLLLQTKSNTMAAETLQTLEKDLVKYLNSGEFASDICNGGSETLEGISVYHYLRSVKECNKERGDPAMCNLKGIVEDRSAWKQMQSLVPWYANFNGMIY